MHTADGDSSPATIRSYYGNAAQFVAWCAEHGINPATATEDDIATCRRELVAQYEVGTVAVKLAAIRRLYEAAVWRGLRQDNPAAGLKAPKDKTERAERVSSYRWTAYAVYWTPQRVTILLLFGIGLYWL